MATRADIDAMRRALELAARARGQTSPNPMVGCVIVNNGVVIAEGWHQAAGCDHAEVVALKKAGDAARGSTLFVTLEPCCHTGRTGPCTEAILKAGVGRVVYAVDDPNPRVSGGGAQRLRAAGIEVEGGVLEEEAASLNEIFFGYQRNQRPWVIVKTAQTLDGRIATHTGDSQWISGSAARNLAHQLRSEVDAVIVGMGTVRADDPALTVRHVQGSNPYRIVMTAAPGFPESCRLLDGNDDCKTIIATNEAGADACRRDLRTARVTTWVIESGAGGEVDPSNVLKTADDAGIQSILIEGGGAVVTSFLRHRLVDKWVQIIAPKIIGEGVSGVGDLGITELAEAIRFDNARFENLGDDVVFSGYPRWGA